MQRGCHNRQPRLAYTVLYVKFVRQLIMYKCLSGNKEICAIPFVIYALEFKFYN